MKNYMELVIDIMRDGQERFDRTGIGSKYIWGSQLKFNLNKITYDTGNFPATTIRPIPLRWAFEEVMLFLRGETQTKALEEKNITIWKGNTSREFLDKHGLSHLPEGDMGKGYGYQWRKFNSGVGHSLNPGVDQIADLLNGLKNDPLSRRHIVSAWNPQQLPEMALPPCHILQHYYITPEKRLNSCFWMRSNDVIYGLPFNIAQYAFLNMIFAEYLGIDPGLLVYQCSDAHIYGNQYDLANKMIDRYICYGRELGLKTSPTVTVKKELKTFDDVLDLQWEDIEVLGYDPHPDFPDKPEMAV